MTPPDTLDEACKVGVTVPPSDRWQPHDGGPQPITRGKTIAYVTAEESDFAQIGYSEAAPWDRITEYWVMEGVK